jgi:hypothetical protein
LRRDFVCRQSCFDLGPHAAELAPSRLAVCRCFDETKAEGALDLMRKTATSLRDYSIVCDIETLVFRCLLEKHFFLSADDLECWLDNARLQCFWVSKMRLHVCQRFAVI